jgi:sugar diacid utilization regulator
MTDLAVAAADLATSAPSDILTHVDGRRLAATCRPGVARAARAVLLRQGAQVVAVQTWAVPVDRAADAHRWARRTLQLVRGGRIRPDAHRVVMCADHRFTLWATADDALAEEISREILAPLVPLTPAWRLNLAETLLLWLTCRESVRIVATHLGVHPNTVRHRAQLLRELFGPALVDPQQCGDLVLALRRVLPVWREARRR